MCDLIGNCNICDQVYIYKAFFSGLAFGVVVVLVIARQMKPKCFEIKEWRFL